MESKKKNMTNNETDAPNGKQSACIVSSVCTPIKGKKNYFYIIIINY